MKKQVVLVLDGTPDRDRLLENYILGGWLVTSVTAGHIATGGQSTQIKVKGDFLLVLEKDGK